MVFVCGIGEELGEGIPETKAVSCFSAGGCGYGLHIGVRQKDEIFKKPCPLADLTAADNEGHVLAFSEIRCLSKGRQSEG